MRTVVEPHVDAANRLTRRWCEVAGNEDFVVSGAGLWPLLGLLASAARNPARMELEAAVGIPADAAHSAALRLIDTMRYSRHLSAALGVWVKRTLPLNSDWLSSLPRGTVDLITDQAALDAWAGESTEGLIKEFPLQLTRDTVLVLATALVARTSWREVFYETTMTPASGPWQDKTVPALSRTTGTAWCATLLEGPSPVTRIIVEGTGDVDVHLLQGAGTAADVLTTGLNALTEGLDVRPALAVGTNGPGLTVREEISLQERDQLHLTLPPFAVRSKHDLCSPTLAALFGLTTARTNGDHFPGISPAPLSVEQGAQDVLARFTREGFEAAAVTAISLDVRGMPPPPTEHRIKVYTATFDRPFGFLAVHRPTGLAIVAGWIASRPPEPPAPTKHEQRAVQRPVDFDSHHPRPVPHPGPVPAWPPSPIPAPHPHQQTPRRYPTPPPPPPPLPPDIPAPPWQRDWAPPAPSPRSPGTPADRQQNPTPQPHRQDPPPPLPSWSQEP
ncbi:hypothetical protein GV792_16815 [Nocardia cyriacigeorgica]|uniref:serpin family protein n=1 Tax=Nocardia cyriacigeorgica TaxID=135487 RepID=UPI0013B761A4|nr:serpin family protein [Nocardia cyriacigeorgica]NEW40500.1 hypothetical protein [Nocardia cyriacigeorgica]NEW51705.1 hypothetical protein [Nocardia cyriacigeorgica]